MDGGWIWATVDCTGMEPGLAEARKVLRAVFGHAEFRQAQSQVIAAILGGRDVLAVMPTGAGKSVCFQVPGLLLPGVTLVVSPLIALMEDQVANLARRGIGALALNSAHARADLREGERRILRGEIKFVYLSPERLLQPRTREFMKHVQVNLFVVDEAHCVSLWGHDFRPSYLRLADAHAAIGRPPIVAVTATATPTVRLDIAAGLRLRQAVEIVTGFDRPNLHLEVLRARNELQRLQQTLQAIRSATGPVIVYASTRTLVGQLVAHFRSHKLRTLGYHAGMSARERAEVQERFLDNRFSCMVATNAFGMGVDKGDIRLVLHYALPPSLEDYYQESGRAGRDGEPAAGVLLCGKSDRALQERLLRSGRPLADEVRQVLEWVRAGFNRRRMASTAPGIQPVVHRERTTRVLAFLVDQGLVCDEGGLIHLRLTATVARMEALAQALPPDAQKLLQQVVDASPSARGWRAWELPPNRSLRARTVWALGELERHSLLTCDLLDLVRPVFHNKDTLLPRALERLAQLHRADAERLDAAGRYAATRRCRTEAILGYFGQEVASMRCRRCDNCTGYSLTDSHGRRAVFRRTPPGSP
jgi:ATP-dependent DNA helicase RecQ